MKVKDQLCKILYRINVVVWRWRYKWNPRFRVSQPCNVCTNFFTRQLATFTRLRTLCNFDFQLIGIDQEGWSDSKTSRSNLKLFEITIIGNARKCSLLWCIAHRKCMINCFTDHYTLKDVHFQLHLLNIFPYILK